MLPMGLNCPLQNSGRTCSKVRSWALPRPMYSETQGIEQGNFKFWSPQVILMHNWGWRTMVLEGRRPGCLRFFYFPLGVTDSPPPGRRSSAQHGHLSPGRLFPGARTQAWARGQSCGSQAPVCPETPSFLIKTVFPYWSLVGLLDLSHLRPEPCSSRVSRLQQHRRFNKTVPGSQYLHEYCFALIHPGMHMPKAPCHSRSLALWQAQC